MTDATFARRAAGGNLVVETRFRVRFFETDQMGVVHHAAYITWFEEGRSAFTRAIGYPYSQMEAEGVSLAVAEVTARYHRSARYDEEVIVATCLTGLPSRGMSFSYEVRRAADGELLVSGSTRHIALDPRGQVRLIPEAMRARLVGRLARMLPLRRPPVADWKSPPESEKRPQPLQSQPLGGFSRRRRQAGISNP